MNELMKFENAEFGEVRTVEINGEGWLVGKDVAEILGYKNTRDALSKHVDEEDRMFVSVYDGKQNRNMIIVNESGVYQLIMKSKTATERQKEDFINFLKKNGLLAHVSFYARKEIGFIGLLEMVLSPFSVSGVKQYSVLSYKIDYYIPSLNVAIEYDENNHKHYTYEQQELRQKLIEEELGCRFIRVTDKKNDEFNVGLVIKELFNIK